MYKIILAAIGLTVSISPAYSDGYSGPPTVAYTPIPAPTCNPMTLQVYFQNGNTMLSDSARRTIETAGDSLSGCAVSSINIVSLASDGRTTSETSALAHGRIDTVQAALADEGLLRADISTELANNPSARANNQLMARRVEVTLAAYRPDIG